MKFYFYKKSFEETIFTKVDSLLPDRFTFASNSKTSPTKGSLLIINELTEDAYYLTRVKNKGKITTFDYRISCVDVKKIKFSIEDLCEWLSLKTARFIDLEGMLLITDQPKKIKLLEEYLISRNPFLKDYFQERQKVGVQKSPDVGIQTKDAFLTAFEIFKIPLRFYSNLTEEQILDWDMNTIPELTGRTPDGKYFLEANGKRLFIQKVHNTPIERCLGVDMLYNFYDENRLIFIQYKCFNYENKRFYKSKDKHFSVELRKMSSLAGICNNQHVHDCNQIRICDCPFFVKLCSRHVPDHREKVYGFYYAVCCWQKIAANKNPFISFDDEPRISNDLFKQLLDAKLIGTRKAHIKAIQKKCSKNRLLLIFSEVEKSDN